MNLSLDTDRYAERQLRLLGELVRTVRDGLREAGVTDDQQCYEATGNLAFAIAAIVDGSRIMALDNATFLPFLPFANERNGSELTAAEGGSWLRVRVQQRRRSLRRHLHGHGVNGKPASRTRRNRAAPCVRSPSVATDRSP